VVPIYHEEGTIDELHRRLTETLQSMGVTYEIVFVDDGSHDRSFEFLKALQHQDSHVVVVKFSRNFGHHIALTAGLDQACGEVIVMMDGDLQDQPEEIPKLHQKLLEGHDMVYAVRMEKKFSWFKRTTSRMYAGLMARISDYGPAMTEGVFRILRRRMRDIVADLRESNRSLVGLLTWTGFRQAGVEVIHGERRSGETKYSLAKMMRLALNTIISFSDFPVKLASYVALFLITISLAGFAALGILGMLLENGVAGWIWLFPTMGIGSGMIMAFIGVLGEYIGQILKEVKKRPLYVLETVLKSGERGKQISREKMS
jgi:dolichol-phosphate mannosyltransferase